MSKRQTILIVDDEELILEIYGEFFNQKHFEILKASTVDIALKKIDEYEGDIDLVLTDINMPNKDGFDLYEELNTDDLQIPVIFMTGYNYDDRIIRKIRKYNADWLAKPIKLEELLKLINKTI